MKEPYIIRVIVLGGGPAMRVFLGDRTQHPTSEMSVTVTAENVYALVTGVEEDKELEKTEESMTIKRQDFCSVNYYAYRGLHDNKVYVVELSKSGSQSMSAYWSSALEMRVIGPLNAATRSEAEREASRLL